MTPLDRFSLARDIQVVLLSIFLAAGGLLLWRGEYRWRPLGAAAAWFVAVALLWVFVPAAVEQPGTIIHRGWRWLEPDTATRWMLTSDLIIVVTLVFLTGGSERSCFSPLYFMLPTFTLLLLNVGTFFYFYSGAALALFALTMFGRNAEAFFRPYNVKEDLPSLVRISRILLWIISALCLILAVHIDVERHKSKKQTSSADMISTGVATMALIIRGAAIEPRQRPVAASTPTPAGKPVSSATPAATAPNTPTRSASQAATTPSPALSPSVTPPTPTATPVPTPLPFTTYSEFLMQFKGLHRKKESVQRRTLRPHIGDHVSWEVRYQGFKSGRKEVLIFFTEINTAPAKHRVVRFAKAPEKYRSVIRRLSKGANLRIEGTLRPHSSTQLFVHISVLTPSN